MSIYINLLIEDEVHLHVLSKILDSSIKDFQINRIFGKRGNTYIKEKLSSFNQAAKFTPYLVLTDLDQIDCAPKLFDEWIKFKRHNNLIFRIAVREAEAWLLADRENFASFLGISTNRIEGYPESILNPKEYILQLATKSKKRNIKEDLIPKGDAIIGRNYNTCLADFIINYWDIENAMQQSKSLNKIMNALNNFKVIIN